MTKEENTKRTTRAPQAPPLEIKFREMLSKYSVDQIDILQKQVRRLLTSEQKMTESMRGQVNRIAGIIMHRVSFSNRDQLVKVLNNELREAEKYHGIKGSTRSSNSLVWGR